MCKRLFYFLTRYLFNITGNDAVHKARHVFFVFGKLVIAFQA